MSMRFRGSGDAKWGCAQRKAVFSLNLAGPVLVLDAGPENLDRVSCC
jgi:hypothetical protein